MTACRRRHLPFSFFFQILLLLLEPQQLRRFFFAAAIRAPPPPPFPPLLLSFPPFSPRHISCYIDPSASSVPTSAVCTSDNSSSPPRIVFSNDDDVLSTRYQYRRRIRLWKPNSPYAASFSSVFVVKFQRDFERSVKRVFGGGLALAITPESSPPRGTGPESLGLFPINETTGAPLDSRRSPRTLAVEIDTSRDTTYSWDPPIPHVGLDINSLRSSASSFLWDGPSFVDRNIAVFVDYDASSFSLSVRFQNLSSSSNNNNLKPNIAKSKLFLSVSDLDLSRYVNELSYVGFSSRVPVTTDGVYILYSWKFSTKWVVKKGIRF